ncbi:hypothetical protein AAMO2058_000674000 [Amorphochlora amoebiformis]
MSKRCNHHGQCSCAWEAKERDIDHGGTLYSCVDRDKVMGLNESKKGSAKNCIKPYDERKDTKKVVRSIDGDGELIIFVPFTVQVKFKSFSVIGGDEGSAPNGVKIWKNRDDIDFDNAEDITCDQEFKLAVDSDGSIQYPVRISKFQNVSSLTFFFTGNYDDDTTQINYLGLKGESDHKKLADQHVSRGIQ